MSTHDLEEKERNREIARNEERRKAIGSMRVSGWAIFIAGILGAIFVGTFWVLTHR